MYSSPRYFTPDKFCIKRDFVHRSNRNQESGCVLPEQPEGGRYQLGGCENARCTKSPGDTVALNSILTYSCKDNYVLSGNTISVCVKNEWYELPSCHSESVFFTVFILLDVRNDSSA